MEAAGSRRAVKVGATGDRLCMANKDRMVDEQGYRHILSVQNFLSCNEPEDDPESRTRFCACSVFVGLWFTDFSCTMPERPCF